MDAEADVVPGSSKRFLETAPVRPIFLRTELLQATFSGIEATLLRDAERHLHLLDAHLKASTLDDLLIVSSDAFARQITVK